MHTRLTFILPVLIFLSFSGYAQLTSTNLPIVFVTTSIPIDSTQVVGIINVIDNSSGTNLITDPATYSGIIGIKTRGSSGNPKISYNVETWSDTSGTSLDVPMLNMPPENDWVLLASYTDRSLLRNLTGFYVYSQMGYYAARMRLCELEVNNSYQGVYLFGEKIKRDTFRLDIAHLQFVDNSGVELTGGYIFRLDDTYDGYWASAYPPPNASSNQAIKFHYEEPKDNDISGVQMAYIHSYVDSFENALMSANFQDTTIGWQGFASHKWFRDYFIFNEVIKSADAYRKATYVYKDKSKKLRIGPPWDLELSMYNTSDCNASSDTGWAYKYSQYCDTSALLPPFWWDRLMMDTAFVQEVKCRYTFLRDNVLDTVTIFHYIDSVATLLNADSALVRNFNQWPIFGVNLVDEPQPPATDYADEITRIKTFYRNRLAFLDGQWLSTDCSVIPPNIVGLLAEGENSYISPNPTTNNFTTHLSLDKTEKVHLSISNLTGTVVYGKDYGLLQKGDHQLFHNIAHIPAGLYIITLQTGDYVRNFKLVKE